MQIHYGMKSRICHVIRREYDSVITLALSMKKDKNRTEWRKCPQWKRTKYPYEQA